MRDKKGLIEALEHLKVETGSLACLGCGYEHNCSTEGCAILRQAELVVECSGVYQCRNCDFYEGGLYPRCFNKKSTYVGCSVRPEDGCGHCSIDLLVESERARSDLAKCLTTEVQKSAQINEGAVILQKRLTETMEQLANVQKERDLAVRRLSEIRDCDDCIHDKDIPADECMSSVGCADCGATDRCTCRNCTMENHWEKWEWNGYLPAEKKENEQWKTTS